VHNVLYYSLAPTINDLGQRYTKETGNRIFRELFSALIEHVELIEVGRIEDTAVHLAQD
jgi:hypothetical protein